MKQNYVAECIEDGEKFDTHFKSSETDKDKLNKLGKGLAMEWGGECINVRKVTPGEEADASAWDFDLTEEENMKGMSD